MEYHVYFKLWATFFYKMFQPAWNNRAQWLELKEQTQNGVRYVLCPISTFPLTGKHASALFSLMCVSVCVSLRIYTHCYIYKHTSQFIQTFSNSPLVCYQIFALITALYLLGHKCDHFSGAIVLKGPYFRLTKIKSPRVFLKGFADHSNEQLSIMNYSSRMRSRKSREEDKSTVHTLLHVVPSLPM